MARGSDVEKLSGVEVVDAAEKHFANENRETTYRTRCARNR
jgi:hypothetical protein